jgi:hypothetical protein
VRNFSEPDAQTRRSATYRYDQGQIMAEVRSESKMGAVNSACHETMAPCWIT